MDVFWVPKSILDRDFGQMKMGDLKCLLALYRYGDLTYRELIKKSSCSYPTVDVAVVYLLKRGLIEKTGDVYSIRQKSVDSKETKN